MICVVTCSEEAKPVPNSSTNSHLSHRCEIKIENGMPSRATLQAVPEVCGKPVCAQGAAAAHGAAGGVEAKRGL